MAMQDYVLFFLLDNGLYGKFDTDREAMVTNIYTKKAGETTAKVTEKYQWDKSPETSAIMAYIKQRSPRGGGVLDRLGDYNVAGAEVGLADVSMTEEDAAMMQEDWKGSLEVYKLNQMKLVV